MIKINEPVPVKSRDVTPVNSGLYLTYQNIILSKDNENNTWFLEIRLVMFESVGYAQKVKFNKESSVSISEDKIKTYYGFKLTNQEVKNNSILDMTDSKIKAELDKIFNPAKVIIV